MQEKMSEKKFMQGKTQRKKFMHKMGRILILNQNSSSSSRKLLQNAPMALERVLIFDVFPEKDALGPPF